MQYMDLWTSHRISNTFQSETNQVEKNLMCFIVTSSDNKLYNTLTSLIDSSRKVILLFCDLLQVIVAVYTVSMLPRNLVKNYVNDRVCMEFLKSIYLVLDYKNKLPMAFVQVLGSLSIFLEYLLFFVCLDASFLKRQCFFE